MAISEHIRPILTELGIDREKADDFARVHTPVTAWLHKLQPAGKPILLGVNGCQGSGKTTFACILTELMAILYDRRVVTLSIDDFYLSKAERENLAREVHPLLRTRGVPGTHDLALATQTLSELLGGTSQVTLPRFSKAEDDRSPESEWPKVAPLPDVVVFEGWCIAARSQATSALQEPMNQLERDEDVDAIWRSHVNEQLENYQTLFARIDKLLMLLAPSFNVVFEWRAQQEGRLIESSGKGMTRTELSRFIAHYERLTRFMLDDLPSRADVLIRLDENQVASAIEFKN